MQRFAVALSRPNACNLAASQKMRLKVGMLKVQFQNCTPRHGTCRFFYARSADFCGVWLQTGDPPDAFVSMLPPQAGPPAFLRRRTGPGAVRSLPPGSRFCEAPPPWRALPAWPTGREGLCVGDSSPAVLFLAGKSSRGLRQAPSRRRRGLRRLWLPRSSGAWPGLRCGLPGDRPEQRRQRRPERHGRQA